MRQRKIKNEEEKLIAFKRSILEIKDNFIEVGNSNEISSFSADKILIDSPDRCRGKWKEHFEKPLPICMELGCGKGKFLTELARAFPQRNYIGIEKQGSVLLGALKKAQEANVSNVIFVHGLINGVEDHFAEEELEGIYLNFSDPWPKDRHAKRRLTHSNYLKGYLYALAKDGFIAIKTDNKDLYKFTLDQFEKLKELQNDNLFKKSFKIVEISENLHEDCFPAKNVTTEYEDKFRAIGKAIYYIKAKVK